jgi:hypothetical protein
MVSEPSRCRKVVSSEPKTETGESIEIEFTQSIQRNGANSQKSPSAIAGGFFVLVQIADGFC